MFVSNIANKVGVYIREVHPRPGEANYIEIFENFCIKGKQIVNIKKDLVK